MAFNFWKCFGASISNNEMKVTYIEYTNLPEQRLQEL